MAKASARVCEAVLRRALINVKPEYFSWPLDAQERYRVSMPDADDFRIRQAVLKALFHIQVDTEAHMKAACAALNKAQRLLFNSTLLPMRGIGADNFFLNEYLGDTTTILDFETLYDYDLDHYQGQEKVRQHDNPAYLGKPYRGSLDASWAQLQIDGVFHYAFLYMAAAYLCSSMNALGSKKIDGLIPHTYIRRKLHDKRDGHVALYTGRIDAGGMEPHLEALQHRFDRYMSERYEALLHDFDEQAPKVVYLCGGTRRNEPHMDCVFSDKTALQRVRFCHFMQDCRAIAGNSRDLDSLMVRERQAVFTYLDQAYQDILDEHGCAKVNSKP